MDATKPKPANVIYILDVSAIRAFYVDFLGFNIML